MKHLVRLLVSLLFVFAPATADATTVYVATVGTPCCGIPAAWTRYMDADAACNGEVVQSPDPTPCTTTFWETLRSQHGPHPTTGNACVVDWRCNCGDCLIGNPENPENLHIGGGTGWQTFGETQQPCTDGSSIDFASCTFHKGKGKGSCPSGICKGNPANILSRNKFQAESVYRSGSGELDLVLWYNSQAGVSYFAVGAFGAHWTSRYFVRVKDSLQGIIAVNRPDGKELEFRAPPSGTFYLKDADVNETLEKLVGGGGATTGWRLTDSLTDEVEEFDAAGKLLLVRNRAGRQLTMTYSTTATPPAIAPAAGLLITVSDHFGRQLNFTYNAQKRVAKLIDPGGGETLFEYDGPSGPAGKKNLTKVTFPDLTTRVFHYGESVHINGGTLCATPSRALPNAMTGLTDEKGVRFATWTYQCNGRVTGSEHAGGVDKYTFTGHGTFVTVVDPLNTSRDVALTGLLGIGRETGTTQPKASGTGTASTVIDYDTNGNVSSRTDFNGNRTDYPQYELPRNLEKVRIEGATTPQARTISTEWHTTFRLPTGIAEPLRKTTFSYDADGSQCGARGALCSKSIQATTDANGSQGLSAPAIGAPRTWTYTYNANGDVLTVNGPRTDVADVTTYTYYANNDADLGRRGRIHTIENAAGHVTSITDYNAHGQPTRIVDANGLETTMTYYPRLQLETRRVGDEITTYHYDPAGQLDRVTLPGGIHEISYTYDEAHRLREIRDNLENRIVFHDLDGMGNRKEEQVFAGSSAVEVRKRDFDVLNRLSKEFSVQSPQHPPTKYGYDDQGNLRTVENPLGHTTTNEYDALNRLKQVTSPQPVLAVTQYAYNGLDALAQVTQVKAPNNLVTTYTVNGLGNLTLQVSPDTGTTENTQHDAAGNLLTQIDAKGQTTTYDYDALNRVTLITFHDKSKQTYTYDEGVNGIGRLTSIRETNPAGEVTSRIAYGYDKHGRIVSDTRTVNGVHVTLYRYDSAGRLDQITYPSGRIVTYTLDSIGRIAQLSSLYAGLSQTLVSNVAYHPFGGVKGFSFGNPPQAYARTYDQDGRIATYTLGGTGYTVGYDAASRIESITQSGNPPNTYAYDNLDRLETAQLPGGMQYTYGYDAVGNRVSRTGSSIEIYGYGTTNNRIASITSSSAPMRNFVFDLNGSTEGDGINSYTYDVRGRMKQATSAVVTSYQVNALGQRIRKTNSLGDTVFGYDQSGHLLAEIGAATGEDYLYPMDGTTIKPTEGYVSTVADLSWRVAGTGDFDGDGNGDILWRHFTTGDNYIYFMNGTTIAAEGYIRTVTDMNWKIAGVGDFNGDGRSDIFWRNSATGENYGYLMNGTTISSEGYVQTVADQTWRVAGVGDFDGDGRSDVLWRNSSSGENYIYFMDGTTISSSGYIRTVADLNWRIAGVGKFDADAKSDIFWHKSSTGETYLYPMDGLNILPTEGYSRTVGTLGWQVKGVADLDGDAKADVVWRNAITGENYLWPMDGLAIKSSEGYFRQVELDWQIAAIRDYDGDGRADIFWRRGQDQQPSREYVYLGDMPVAAFLSGSSIPHYIHVDHLNTPRLVANQSGQTVWRWDQREPFGAHLPDENPSGLGAFEFTLRYPGQYFDKETNLHYNYYRDYDPTLGRYVESDPIGLWGGLNTYAYAKSSSLRYLDPKGLRVERCCRSAGILYGKVDHCWLKTDSKNAGMNSSPSCRIAGDEYELPYKTPVYISDHSCDTPDKCQQIDDIDEDCVNEELGIGQSLGRFDIAFNNCRSFANSVIEKCSTKNIPRTPYFGNGGR